ncbi:MAG: pre-toxin TG domain-containing protein [Bdellovibrionales bacterium]
MGCLLLPDAPSDTDIPPPVVDLPETPDVSPYSNWFNYFYPDLSSLSSNYREMFRANQIDLANTYLFGNREDKDRLSLPKEVHRWRRERNKRFRKGGYDASLARAYNEHIYNIEPIIIETARATGTQRLEASEKLVQVLGEFTQQTTVDVSPESTFSISVSNLSSAELEQLEVLQGKSSSESIKDSLSGNYLADMTRIEEAFESRHVLSPQQRKAKAIGLTAIEEGRVSFESADSEAAEFYQKIAVEMADITLGFVPFVGFGKDTYEAITGKRLIDGEELDKWGRGFAVFGVVTLGFGSVLSKGLRAIDKLAPGGSTLEGGIERFVTSLANGSDGFIKHSDGGLRINYSSHIEREVRNFEPGYRRIQGAIDEDLILVKFHDSENMGTMKYWTTLEQSNSISTIDDLHEQLALARVWGARDVVSVAKIPKGTEVSAIKGMARPQTDDILGRDLSGQGVQYLFENFSVNWLWSSRKITND